MKMLWQGQVNLLKLNSHEEENYEELFYSLCVLKNFLVVAVVKVHKLEKRVCHT